MVINVLKDLFSIYKNKAFLISSYPKCGSTYLRFFLLNYLLLTDGQNRSLNHKLLNEFMPEIGHGNVSEARFNKFVKTHHPVGFYKQSRVVRIIRNPYESLCSAYEYYNRSTELEFKNINEFLNHKRGLISYKAHFELFIKGSGNCIKYENLVENPEKYFRILMDVFSIKQTSEELEFLINSISRDKMVKAESNNTQKKTNNFSKKKNYDKYKKEIDQVLMTEIMYLDKKYQNIL